MLKIGIVTNYVPNTKYPLSYFFFILLVMLKFKENGELIRGRRKKAKI